MLDAVSKRKNAVAVALARRRMQKMTPEERSAVARLGGLASARSRAENMTKAERVAIARKAGAARIESLTPEERKAIARKAAAARWGNAQRSKGSGA
jgi:hypothetical protein